MDTNKKSILVVDDSPENIDILVGILQHDYTVRAALDGKTALSIAASDKTPDCIILDVMMPEMDGFEVCRRLKSDDRTVSIPVIFITASDEVSDESTGFAVGGVDYITKPVSPPLVLARVQTHLSLFDRTKRLEELVRDRTEELTQTNEFLRGIMECSGSAIFQVALDGKINFFNSRTSLLTGYDTEDLNKMTYDSLFDLEDNKELIHCFQNVIDRGESVAQIEALLHRKDEKTALAGVSLSPYIIDGSIKGAVLLFEDITSHRSMELQLMHADRMSAIGEMATGVAHELNQPLNVIKMATQLIKSGIDDHSNTDDFIVERTGKILENVDRASRIINHLRSFGRKDDAVFSEINVNIPIRNAISLVEDQLKRSSINYRLDLDENLPLMLGDSNRLEQVFINLMINARDALDGIQETTSGKKILVRSYYDNINKTVVILVSDNGPGIPSKNIGRVFEPFFTTKGIGSGTGLGLSISYGIIQSHKGTIRVESCKSGTIFTITLPVYKE